MLLTYMYHLTENCVLHSIKFTSLGILAVPIYCIAFRHYSTSGTIAHKKVGTGSLKAMAYAGNKCQNFCLQ